MARLRAVVLLLLALPGWGQAPLRMAVMAYRPKPQVQAQWLPMARHLQAVLGRPVTITPYDFGEMSMAVARSEVDVVLTNPGHYTLLRQHNVLSAPLVTQVAKADRHRLLAFGGVIFARVEDGRINALADLAGKRIATPGRESLGGYQLQVFELLEAGGSLPGREQLLSLGMPHDQTVTAVLAGKADVGFVRSGVLEAMAREGKLELGRVKVLNRQELPSFPYMVSTRLHPEWPLATLPQVDAALADQLAIALLQVRPDSEAALAAGIYGFTTPADYSGVEILLQRLRLPPFDLAPAFTLADLWQRYTLWISALGLLLAALAVASARLVFQNRHIQTSDARSSAILNNVDACIYLKDTKGRYLFANRRLLEIWNKGLAEVVGHSDAAFFEAEALPWILEVDRLVLEEGRTIKVEETNRVKGSQSLITYWSTKLPLRRKDGSIYALCGISTDISERKASEEAKAEAEKSLREAWAFSEQIISSAQEGIAVFDLQGRFVRINAYLETLSGLSSAELRGKPPAEHFAFLAANDMADTLQRVLQGERITTPPFPWEFPRTGRSGWATSVQGPLLGAQGEIIGAIAVSTDITELRRAEELQRKLEADLHQTQKLDSLGSLAGGIAHDMNNVLAAIQAIAQALTVSHSSDASLREPLGIIEQAAIRGRDLVRGLTQFARKELREPELLDLNALVQGEMAILRRTTLQKVALVLELDLAQPQVRGERSSLATALMNLNVNALDAMPEGGTLTLRTQVLDEDWVALAVADSGQGMPPEVLARAIEPFFTTKAIGKGTGLGLAMVYTTAKAHGGSVAITSAPGQGTCVTLRLPVATGGQPAKVETVAAHSRSLRILQVDDDELILASMPIMIAAYGHQVSTATGGQEALAMLAQGLEVDLVILDLNMPGMNGEETLRELRNAWPGLPVLLATGFLDANTEALLRQDAWVRSITKPFAMDDLDAKFREFF